MGRNIVILLFALLFWGLTSEAQSNLDQGIQKYRAEEYFSAISFLNTAIYEEPENKRCYYYRGASYMAIDELDKGFKDLQAAVDFGMRDPNLFLLLGKCYFTKGDYFTAIAYFERSAGFSMNQKLLSYYLGTCHAKLKEYPYAIKYLQKELDKGTEGNYSLHLNLALSYNHMGKYEAALEHAEKSLELKKSPAGYEERGYAYFKLNKYGFALSDIGTAIEMSPDADKLYVTRAEINLASDNPESALHDCNKALQVNFRNAQASYYKGVILKERGEIEKACQCFMSVKKYQPHRKWGEELAVCTQ